MGPRHDMSFCTCTTACLASEILVSIGPCPHLWFVIAKQRLFAQNYKSLWVTDHTCGFSMQNSVFWTRITSLYGSQTWPVICACTTTCLPSELLVSMCPRPHQCFLIAKQRLFAQNYKSLWVTDHTCGFSIQNSVFWTRITSLYGSQTWPVICACTTTCSPSELLVSMCPRPHQCFLIAKQRLFAQNYKSLWVTDHTCGFSIQNSVFWTRITSLYGSQTWPVICACTTTCLPSELLVSMCPRPLQCFLIAKQRLLVRIYKSLWVPDLTCRFVHAKCGD